MNESLDTSNESKKHKHIPFSEYAPYLVMLIMIGLVLFACLDSIDL